MNLKTPLKGGDINIKKLRETISKITLASPHYDFLSKLHRSPWKEMWPEKDYKKPPDNFIGKLWLGVRDSFKSDKSDNVAKGSDVTHSKDDDEPYVPLEKFLDEKNKMLIDRLTYFKLLQDKGFSLEGNKKPKKAYTTKKPNGLLDKAYKDIYDLSILFYEILNHNKKTFKLPKNKSAVVNKIGKLIMDNRELKGYGDIDDDDIRI